MTERACCVPMHVIVDGVRDRRHTCAKRWWQPVRPVMEALERRRNGGTA